MEQEPAQSAPKSTSLATVITASVITCLIAGGGIVAVHKSLKASISDMSYAQQEALDKLSKRITTLETQTRELAARPTPDIAPVEELRSGVVQAQTTIATLSERIAEIEKKPAPMPQLLEAPVSKSLPLLKATVLSGSAYQTELDLWDKEHPKATASLDTLRTYANSGISSEASLRNSLRNLLTQQPNEKVAFPEQSTVARINAHLSNFISIKKKSPPAPELQKLREQVDTATLSDLETQVSALPEALKTPFIEWSKIAAARAKALNELHQLDGNL